jgi:hypothetical protein
MIGKPPNRALAHQQREEAVLKLVPRHENHKFLFRPPLQLYLALATIYRQKNKNAHSLLMDEKMPSQNKAAAVAKAELSGAKRTPLVSVVERQ